MYIFILVGVSFYDADHLKVSEFFFCGFCPLDINSFGFSTNFTGVSKKISTFALTLLLEIRVYFAQFLMA